jgi:energy-coupling factor transporter ATP-binding protein EcfA2
MSDMLTQALEGGGFSRENIGAVLREWILKDFLQDRYATLAQAGHRPDERVPLAKVFIDLRVAEREFAEVVTLDEATERQETFPFAAAVLSEEFPPCDAGRTKAGSRNTHLLVGGPGQGKSTVGQFVAQLHRLGLLDAHRDALRKEDVVELDELRAQCTERGFAVPTRALFPVRVELRVFAAWLAEQQTTNADLVAYIAHDVQHLTGLFLDPTDLARVLKRVPLLLVLDGLDEVPPEGSRDAVAHVVWEFLSRERDRGDVVIAATRPQGYGRKFEGFRIWHLAPLSAKTALDYARRLSEVWFQGRERDRIKTLERIERALREDTTARLMRNPLQVTIMTLLVNRSGNVPRSRWELFERYYTTLYEREKERGTYASSLLEEHSDVIDAVHEHVGLLLQTEGESVERAAAFLARERLLAIIVRDLDERGYAGRSRSLAEEILRATAERLVLLAESRPGWYSFDVRSLQEFMAARQLTRGESAVVFERLRTVGRPLYWRNVVLFAVGRFFVGNVPQAMRYQMSVGLCERLAEDHAHEADWGSYPGARLALDLLSDGAVAKDLRCLRMLVLKTLSLLAAESEWITEEPIGRTIARYWEHLEEDEKAEVVGALRKVLETSPGRETWNAAWSCVIVLASMTANEEVRRLLDEAWRRTPVAWRQWHLRALLGRAASSARWLVERLEEEADQYSPSLFEDHSLKQASAGPRVSRARKFVEEGARSGGLPLREVLGEGQPIGSVNPGRPVRGGVQGAEAPFKTGAWSVFGAVEPFLLRPSSETLAAVLRSVADIVVDPSVIRSNMLPWPLAASLRFATTADSRRALADRTESGALGDIETWEEMEQTWIRDGFILDDLFYEPGEGLPFDPKPGVRGLPGTFEVWPGYGWSDAMVLEGLLLKARSYRAEVRRRVAAFVAWACDRAVATELSSLSSEALEVLLANAPTEMLPLSLLAKPERFSTEEIDRLDVALRARGTWWGWGRIYDERAGFVKDWVALWCLKPTRVGVLRMLSNLIGEQGLEGLKGTLDYAALHDSGERGSALVLQAALGELDAVPIDRLAEELVRASGNTGELSVFSFTFRWGGSERHLATLVDECWRRREEFPQSWRVHFQHWKVARLQQQKSTLGTPARWAALELPSPGPEIRGAVQEARPWMDVIALSAVEIHQLRAFESIVIPASPPRADGQWLVLLGENGVGKTTVLRAIAMALCPPDTATELARQTPAPHRRDRASRGTVSVTLNGLRFGAIVNGDPRNETVRPDEFTRDFPDDARPWVVGYGCRRGSALGGAKRQVAFGANEQLDSLFDGDRGLIHAETWLAQQKLAAELDKTGAAVQRYASIQKVLCETLQLEAIEVEADARVRVRSKVVGDVLFSGLSDGYVTTAGWTIDLIARWVDRCVTLKEKYGERFDARDVLGANFNLHMTGVVLLDEVDLLLHPRWQMRLVRSLKRSFPKLTFVATTHSPLVLVGLKREEIVVLERGADGNPVARPATSSPALKTGSELLESFFGVREAHPSSLGRDMQRYLFLANNPYRSDTEDVEARQLLGRLRAEEVDPGFEPVERETIA